MNCGLSAVASTFLFFNVLILWATLDTHKHKQQSTSEKKPTKWVLQENIASPEPCLIDSRRFPITPLSCYFFPQPTPQLSMTPGRVLSRVSPYEFMMYAYIPPLIYNIHISLYPGNPPSMQKPLLSLWVTLFRVQTGRCSVPWALLLVYKLK